MELDYTSLPDHIKNGKPTRPQNYRQLFNTPAKYQKTKQQLIFENKQLRQQLEEALKELERLRKNETMHGSNT